MGETLAKLSLKEINCLVNNVDIGGTNRQGVCCVCRLEGKNRLAFASWSGMVEGECALLCSWSCVPVYELRPGSNELLRCRPDEDD